MGPLSETDTRGKPAGTPPVGCLFIISAPSGTGKTTLCKAMRERFPDLVYSVSSTTRSPRRNEIDGVDYHFISPEKFEESIRKGEWAEWAEVHGNYYGTSAILLDRNLKSGNDILLDIDVNGAKQIKGRFPESITIFIMPPSLDELRRRLENRNSDNEAVIRRRIENAREEIASKDFYDHIIINDRLEEATVQLADLIERCRAGRAAR